MIGFSLKIMASSRTDQANLRGVIRPIGGRRKDVYYERNNRTAEETKLWTANLPAVLVQKRWKPMWSILRRLNRIEKSHLNEFPFSELVRESK